MKRTKKNKKIALICLSTKTISWASLTSYLAMATSSGGEFSSIEFVYDDGKEVTCLLNIIL